MPRYLLSLSVPSGGGAPRPQMSDEQMRESWQRINTLNDELRAAGAWVFGGRLHEPDTATVVRVSEKGDILTTDGPFVESKEHLGGFYIIEAKDLDAALGWASKTTAATGMPIEVRPFADSTTRDEQISHERAS